MESELFTLTEQEQWYTNKEIFEILEEFKSDITEKNNQLISQMSKLELEMVKTTTLIRDYNGLRSKIDECEKEIAQIKTSQSTEKSTKKDGRDFVGWGIAVILFVLTVADKFIK